MNISVAKKQSLLPALALFAWLAVPAITLAGDEDGPGKVAVRAYACSIVSYNQYGGAKTPLRTKPFLVAPNTTAIVTMRQGKSHDDLEWAVRREGQTAIVAEVSDADGLTLVRVATNTATTLELKIPAQRSVLYCSRSAVPGKAGKPIMEGALYNVEVVGHDPNLNIELPKSVTRACYPGAGNTILMSIVGKEGSREAGFNVTMGGEKVIVEVKPVAGPVLAYVTVDAGVAFDVESPALFEGRLSATCKF